MTKEQIAALELVYNLASRAALSDNDEIRARQIKALPIIREMLYGKRAN